MRDLAVYCLYHKIDLCNLCSTKIVSLNLNELMKMKMINKTDMQHQLFLLTH